MISRLIFEFDENNKNIEWLFDCNLNESQNGITNEFLRCNQVNIFTSLGLRRLPELMYKLIVWRNHKSNI